MMSIIKKILFLLFLVIVILTFFGLGFHFGRDYQKTYQLPEEIDFSLFWQVWNVVHERFPDREKLDVKKMIHGAISGMIEILEDPGTVFFTPEEAKEFEKDMKGIFEGVGMQIGIRERQLQVISPIKNTPAYRAGLRPGDKIIEINGVSTINMTIERAVSLIRGQKGTKVTLTIFREEWNEKREIEIERGIIKIPSLSWQLIEENIAHLKLYNFTRRIKGDFRDAANEILEKGAEKIILDLRNNPGGYLEAAKSIAGWFLENGQVVVIKDFGKDREQEIFKSRGPSRLLEYPIVILINQGTASGSEILAAALRDNRDVKIIGETSFGKGSVQELVRLKEGASLKVTVANWLTPDGKFITNQGLEPDIVVEITEEDFKQGRDPQLDKAIEVIRELR
ncbi:S41 family peptidase [Dehalococcoidia bacterium]|nr:S41 family peptidase [Dehalococcoidia bacterium]